MLRVQGLILVMSVMLVSLVSPVALVAQPANEVEALKQEIARLKFEALKREIEDLKKGQAAIQKDVQDIKKLLSSTRTPRAAAAPRQPTVSLKGQPFKGSEQAKLVLVEFSD